MYLLVKFENERQAGEFRIQCCQALMAISIQRLLTRLESQKRDYVLVEELAFFEYILKHHQQLYIILIKSLEKLLKAQSEQQQCIFKVV